jgi:hypothetical protein
MRYFRVIVRPHHEQTDAVQGYIEAEDEATARAMLPKLSGLLRFDQSVEVRLRHPQPGRVAAGWTCANHLCC